MAFPNPIFHADLLFFKKMGASIGFMIISQVKQKHIKTSKSSLFSILSSTFGFLIVHLSEN